MGALGSPKARGFGDRSESNVTGLAGSTTGAATGERPQPASTIAQTMRSDDARIMHVPID